MNFNKSLNNLKDELSNLLKIMLVSERINSQRCLNEDLDTTQTIIDHKETSDEFTEEEVDNLLKEAKRLLDMMLVSERVNSQRCLNENLDTTKTIIDHVEKIENSDSELQDKKLELNKVISQIKGILNEMLVLERINSQRCLNENLDTTKTIIEHNE